MNEYRIDFNSHQVFIYANSKELAILEFKKVHKEKYPKEGYDFQVTLINKNERQRNN